MTFNAWQLPGIDKRYSKEHIKQQQDPRHNQWGYWGEQKQNTPCTKYPDCDGYILCETLGQLYKVPCEHCNKEQREIYDKKNHCTDE